MKIKFRQTGGFAGLTKAIEIDTAQMPPNEAEVLKLMVDRAAFFEVSSPNSRAMPDREQYTISIESEERSRQLYLGASNIPAQLQELVNYLAKQAQYEKR
ncbi:MAG: protealysin inhibitor emfourin [Geitlerinemataceae cyanobacterium]